jgi:phage tail sheath protein FI
MPVQPTYPGVYISEIPSGVRTITGVSTSITAFVGRACRGPTDQPVTINSFGEFQRTFGGLWDKSRLGFAVRDYFLNGGSQAIIVRLYHPQRSEADRVKAAKAAHDVADVVADALQNVDKDPAVTKESVINKAKSKVNDFDAGSVEKEAAQAVAMAVEKVPDVTPPAAAKYAADEKAKEYASKQEEAAAANSVARAARDKADSGAKTADEVAQAAFTAAGKFEKNEPTDAAEQTAKAAEYAANLHGSTVNSVLAAAQAEAKTNQNATEPRKSAAERVYQAAADAAVVGATVDTVKNAARSEAEKVKAEALAVQAAADAVAGVARDEAAKNAKALQTVAKNAAGEVAAFSKARITAGTLEMEAANEGEWGNSLRVRIDYEVKEPSEADEAAGLAKRDFFNITIYDGTTGLSEVFRNVTVKSGPDKLDEVLKERSKLLRVTALGADVPPVKTGGPVAPWADDTYFAVMEQASDGTGLQKADFIGRGDKEGLKALDNADLFNLLCIPPYVNGKDIDIFEEAADYCKSRRAIFLVDPPSKWTSKEDAKTNMDAIGSPSPNAAVFFPRLKQPNPLRSGRVEEFVPCGTVAGVFARIDAERGVWKAPAGLDATLKGVQELSLFLTDQDNGELNPLGINCLRTFRDAGRVVWGARTRVGADRAASEWKYIPVRRTALFIEESLYRGTQWVVFEPNDEPLWAQIRVSISAFMHTLFRQGAFQGQNPKDAYLVKCDKETTTQDDINRGVVNILVGFAPLKPAEFVMIQIQQMAGQIQV